MPYVLPHAALIGYVNYPTQVSPCTHAPMLSMHLRLIRHIHLCLIWICALKAPHACYAPHAHEHPVFCVTMHSCTPMPSCFHAAANAPIRTRTQQTAFMDSYTLGASTLCAYSTTPQCTRAHPCRLAFVQLLTSGAITLGALNNLTGTYPVFAAVSKRDILMAEGC